MSNFTGTRNFMCLLPWDSTVIIGLELSPCQDDPLVLPKLLSLAIQTIRFTPGRKYAFGGHR